MPLLDPSEITVEALMADLPMQRNARNQIRLQLMTLQEGVGLLHNPVSQSPVNQRHVVAENDLLQVISVRYFGVPDYWLEIARVNSIEYPYSVYPGQILNIPDVGHP